jgi:hypothetical protein
MTVDELQTDYCSPSQAAIVLRVEPWKIHRLFQRGTLDGVVIAGRTFISRASVERVRLQRAAVSGAIIPAITQ